MTNKILVSIASYKDVDIINTIEDLYEKAEQPNRVYVGLFLQDTPKEISRICSFFSNFIYKANLKIKTISFEDAKGCGWARNIILKELYDNENYFNSCIAVADGVGGWVFNLIKLKSIFKLG